MAQEPSNSFGARGGWWVAAQMPLLLLAFVIPLWARHPATGALLQVLAYAGFALLAAGLALFLAGVSTLGRGLTPFPRPLPEAELRTTGAYALVRHPLYSGILLMSLGWSLGSLSMAGTVFDLVLAAFFDRKAAHEELWLTEKFAGYPAYRQRVKKLIPWIY